MTTRTRAERETIICRAEDEDTWHVFTEVPAHVRKLTRLHGPGQPKGQGYVWRVAPGEIVFRKQGSTHAPVSQKAKDGLARWRQQQADAQAPAEVIK